MMMRLGDLGQYLLRLVAGLVRWISPANNYLVTVCLGASGIFFARAFPTSDIAEFGPKMLAASALLFFIGLALRIYLRDESGN